MTTDFEMTTNALPVLPTAAPARQGLSTPRALGGLMLVAAAVLAGCGGGSDSPPAASPAPPAATPAPPAAAPAPPAATPTPVATTVPANFATGSALPNQGIVYYKDANANATLDAGERAVVYNPATQHYYELVTNLGAANAVTGLTWDAALAAAAARGGHLLIGETNAEVEFVRSTFAYAAGSAVPSHGGLQITHTDGSLGAWIGLVAANSAASVHGTWSWIQPNGTAGGPALAADAPWLVHETFANPDGQAVTGKLRGAMTGGNDLAADETPAVAPNPSPSQSLYDLQSDQPNAQNQPVVSRYVVEYDSAAAVTSVLP